MHMMLRYPSRFGRRPRDAIHEEATLSTANNDSASDSGRADFSDVTGGSSSTAPADVQKRTVTVQAGDSLAKIAKRELGDSNKWHAIFEANKDTIKNPDLIQPGQVLTLPSSGDAK
jgi:nucleoid-associated protein YgaU